ncbi:hypothetical protein LAZ67_5001362 [Cordylochernes scorpioides]|uniref:Uncharacterized protein n=1 Tax=Cordylochernes scorpioides TaxID=51811 RepID=A0ABY6KJ24_9ARAC|nr:hypothetical protein LAZ67_5001362 [Cordylochernes scorpioides]
MNSIWSFRTRQQGLHWKSFLTAQYTWMKFYGLFALSHTSPPPPSPYGSCHKIIGEHLNMKKLCGYFVPRNLTDQQRETRLSICKDLIETANNDSDFFKQ